MPKIKIQPDLSDSFCFPENSEEWIHVLVGERRMCSADTNHIPVLSHAMMCLLWILAADIFLIHVQSKHLYTCIFVSKPLQLITGMKREVDNLTEYYCSSPPCNPIG